MTNVPTLQVITENSDWLAINKSAGRIVERNPWESPAVEDLVYQYLADQKKNPYVGVVHRLDRPTSGLLLFAKKKSVLKSLNELFAKRKIRKTYLAITENVPKDKNGSLRHYLKKNQKQKRADIYDQPSGDTQEVILSYHILRISEGKALLEIFPKTGKFHQIRAQLSAIGCPILGDFKYGGKENYHDLSIALHAWKLTFVDPKTGDKINLEAPMPLNPEWTLFNSSNQKNIS